jgi:cytochrome oxidase assembly protein ShyY1
MNPKRLAVIGVALAIILLVGGWQAKSNNLTADLQAAVETSGDASTQTLSNTPAKQLEGSPWAGLVMVGSALAVAAQILKPSKS